jgi:hypothetical protein
MAQPVGLQQCFHRERHKARHAGVRRMPQAHAGKNMRFESVDLDPLQKSESIPSLPNHRKRRHRLARRREVRSWTEKNFIWNGCNPLKSPNLVELGLAWTDSAARANLCPRLDRLGCPGQRRFRKMECRCHRFGSSGLNAIVYVVLVSPHAGLGS